MCEDFDVCGAQGEWGGVCVDQVRPMHNLICFVAHANISPVYWCQKQQYNVYINTIVMMLQYIAVARVLTKRSLKQFILF